MSHRPAISLGTFIVAALVVFLWAAALMVPSPTQSEPLRVAVGIWAGTEPLILARESGDLDSRRVNLVEMNWTSAAMRAVSNKVVDATVLSLDEVIRQVHQGYPLKIVMVTDISDGADSLMARAGITNIADLKGCRIGYEPRTSAAWLLNRALREAGLQLTDVQHVPLNPAEVEDIFLEMSLDAAILSEPWRQRLRSLDLKCIYDSSIEGASIIRVLAVHPTAIVEHRDALRSLIWAYFKWQSRLYEGGNLLNPILRREGVQIQEFEEILKHLKFVSLDQNRKWLSREDPWLGEQLMELQKSLVGDANAELPYLVSEVFDSSLLEELP